MMKVKTSSVTAAAVIPFEACRPVVYERAKYAMFSVNAKPAPTNSAYVMPSTGPVKYRPFRPNRLNRKIASKARPLQVSSTGGATNTAVRMSPLSLPAT